MRRFVFFGIRRLSLESPLQLLSIVDSIVSGREELTLFCVEGSVINGPNGTGMYDSIHGKPKRDLIAALCNKAEYVLAMGTCAAFGGYPQRRRIRRIRADFNSVWTNPAVY